MTEKIRDDGEDVPGGGAGAEGVDHVSWCHCSTFKRGPFRVVLQMLNLQLDVAKEAERFHNYDSDSEEKEVKCMELLEFDTSWIEL